MSKIIIDISKLSKYNENEISNISKLERQVRIMDVGQKIRIYLEEKDISQIDLCARTNIAPSKMNLSLNGKRRFSFPEYQAICWALGVGVDTFLEARPLETASA